MSFLFISGLVFAVCVLSIFDLDIFRFFCLACSLVLLLLHCSGYVLYAGVSVVSLNACACVFFLYVCECSIYNNVRSK